MQSFTTLYRALVMGATLAIAVMGWRLYGPSAAECTSLALNAVRYVELRLRPLEEATTKTPTPTAPPMQSVAAPTAALNSPPLLLAAETSGGSGRIAPVSGPADDDVSLAPVGSQNVAPPDEQGRLRMLLDELAKLDVQNPELAPWGADGQHYRFCCRATLGNSPQWSRHFEAVAAEPAQAVEHVLAQVTSWRSAGTAQ